MKISARFSILISKNEMKNERKNEMEHIGKYKGYDVYKVPKKEMKRSQDRVIYAVAETGELVFKNEVCGKVNFASGSVQEFDDHKCYPYKYPAADTTVVKEAFERPKTRGKRAETKTYDDYKGETIGDVDLDKMIDDFIKHSRTQTIEEMVGIFVVEG